MPALHRSDNHAERHGAFAPSWPMVLAVLVVLGSALAFGAARIDAGRQPAPSASPPGQPPTEQPSADPSPMPRATRTPRPTSTPIVTPSPSPSPSPTPIATPVPTVPPMPAPTVRPTPAPTPIPTSVGVPQAGDGPLPECVYTDFLTKHHGLEDWQISLLDTIYQLPSGYAPTDLIDSSAAGVNTGYLIRGVMVDDLRAMAAAARAAGSPIQIVSGYRSYTQQKGTFDHWVHVGGYEQALRTSARPGHSEHQLGTAIDVTSEGGSAPWEYGDWGATAAGSWMAANSWRYGFILSYPSGASAVSCYSYEPWHFRYVGRDLAAQVVGAELVLRQFLWEIQ